MKTLVAVLAGLGLIVVSLAGLALAMLLAVSAALVLIAARVTGRRPGTARRDIFGTRPTASGAPGATSGGAQPAGEGELRIWNDGRGTIIDMRASTPSV